MGFDLTMIAPGPAGTTMIGESNIDAAARRGRERIRREQEANLAEKKVDATDGDALSEKTLAAPQSTSTPTSTSTATAKDTDVRSETTLAPSLQTKGAGQSRESGIRGRWERIQQKWRGEDRGQEQIGS